MKETEMQGRARKYADSHECDYELDGIEGQMAEFAREELLSAAKAMRNQGGAVVSLEWVAEWLERRAKQ